MPSVDQLIWKCPTEPIRKQSGRLFCPIIEDTSAGKFGKEFFYIEWFDAAVSHLLSLARRAMISRFRNESYYLFADWNVA